MKKFPKKDRPVVVSEMLLWLENYPAEGEPRRSADGFPGECAYDEFSYKRMVTWWREHCRRMRSILDTGIDPEAE